MLISRLSLGALVIVVIVALSGASYEQAMRRRALREFPAPGRLVDVGGGRRIQIDCRGTGSPTVVLESGLDNFGSLAWASVHDSIARTTRVCAYSRAGVMWSDPADGPLEGGSVVRDLHAALTAAGESPPWVMVGHSLGGPYVMIFTERYGSEVAGLVLVDASHPDQFARFREAVGKSTQPTPGIVRVGAALAWTGIVRLLPSPPAPSTWPADIDRVAPAFLPVSVGELLKEIKSISATLETAGQMRQLGNRPLVVLTPLRPQSPQDLRAMGLTPEQGERLQAASRTLRDDQMTWSRCGRQELVADAAHYVQFDRPDVVINAVRDVVASVRAADGGAGWCATNGGRLSSATQDR